MIEVWIARVLAFVFWVSSIRLFEENHRWIAMALAVASLAMVLHADRLRSANVKSKAPADAPEAK